MEILKRLLIIAPLAVLWILPLSGQEDARLPSTSSRLPRKVIVGSAMEAFWVEYPGLQRRLEQLSDLIDRMSQESLKAYGRDLDLAVLPEVAVTGEAGDDVFAHSFPWDGPVKETFSRKAREHHCYIVVPTYLLEGEGSKKIASNVGVLLDRQGAVVGVYRKVHPAVDDKTDSMEGGITPGQEVPVFDCDFGKVGIQICFDIYFDSGWNELARKGAELVIWPSQTPQTVRPAFQALQHRFYVVSSTWRNNASLFEPTGRITAQIKPPQKFLVQEIDLSYAIVPWSAKLKKGATLKASYGDRIGFHYYEDEDCGVFWSNDAKVTIREMIQSIGARETEEEMAHVRGVFRRAGIPRD